MDNCIPFLNINIQSIFDTVEFFETSFSKDDSIFDIPSNEHCPKGVTKMQFDDEYDFGFELTPHQQFWIMKHMY